jgi:hypothetical protein
LIASKLNDHIGSEKVSFFFLVRAWECSPTSCIDAATHAVVQQLALTCMYPRSLLSPTDAEFSAKFMKTLHDVGTPGYSTIAAYANVSPHTNIVISRHLTCRIDS